MRLDKPKILVADDDSGIRGLMRIILEHRGFEMLTAKSGPEAIELFMKDSPSLVILDLHMPGMNGLDVLERLHALDRRTPIIILSGADTESLRPMVVRLGATEVFQKGTSLQGLANVIEDSLTMNCVLA